MLREFGVKGVKVNEVFSLEDEMLEFLPYALIPSCVVVGFCLMNSTNPLEQEASIRSHLSFPLARR